MPGPGGGSSGGGFHGGGGGFGGGGFHGGGGGFGGGFGGRPPHRRFYGGWGFPWFFGPRFYYGGGCLGGIIAWIIGPIIALIMVTVIAVFVLISMASNVGKKELQYDEQKFEVYADQCYQEAFGKGTEGYEDHILIVLLTYEDNKQYDCIAWVGDDINSRINKMFGNQTTAFGRAMTSSINNTDYTYSLGSNLAMAVDQMSDKVTELGLSSSFYCDEKHVKGTSHLDNRTAYTINETAVNRSLESFTEETGIETVIVVAQAKDVFSYRSNIGSILALIILVIIAGVLIYVLVKAIQAKKNGGNANQSGNNYQNTTDNW